MYHNLNIPVHTMGARFLSYLLGVDGDPRPDIKNPHLCGKG